MAARENTHERTLLPGPEVAGHTIQRDASGTAFLIDQKLIYCTPAKYRLLLLLLQQADRPVSHERLLLCLDGHVPTDARKRTRARGRIAHHLSELRPLIWAVGLDVVNVMRIGYLLLSSPAEEREQAPGQEAREGERANGSSREHVPG